MPNNKKHSIHKSLKKWLTLLGKPFFRVFFLIGTCLVCIAAILLVYRIDPLENPFAPACSFYYFTGLYCPACGMTRAMYHVLHGHFPEAISMNALWPGFVLFIGLALSLWFYWLVTGKNPFQPANRFLHPAAAWLIVIVLFAFWIFRNIPVYPFTLLAP